LAREHPGFGYRRLHLYLHKEMGVNHKKVQRVYRELGLTVKRTRRKHLRRTLQPRPVLTAPNQEWLWTLPAMLRPPDGVFASWE
jgi:putative transposase